jgi:hypothetical protein
MSQIQIRITGDPLRQTKWDIPLFTLQDWSCYPLELLRSKWRSRSCPGKRGHQLKLQAIYQLKNVTKLDQEPCTSSSDKNTQKSPNLASFCDSQIRVSCWDLCCEQFIIKSATVGKELLGSRRLIISIRSVAVLMNEMWDTCPWLVPTSRTQRPFPIMCSGFSCRRLFFWG